MKKIITIFILILSFYNYGQNKIEISLQQDARLFLVGDQKGNEPLTINFLSKLEVPVYNLEKSHLSIYLGVEYADLVGENFKRYSIGTGYIVKSIYGKIGAGAYLDFGKIYRKDEGFNSFSLSGELNYRLSEKLKLICTQQLTYRKDLVELYNSNNKYVISGFIGLKYSL